MTKYGYLLLPLVLGVFLTAIGAGTTLAQEDKGNYTRDHEVCGITPKWNYYGGSKTLEWGGIVICSSTVYDIYISVELYYELPWNGNWVVVQQDDNLCGSNVCDAARIRYNPTYGDYKIKGCFRADGSQSSWDWECWEWQYSLP